MSTQHARANFGGDFPVYLSAPVKAFSGNKESLEDATLAGVLALLDACGAEAPELVLLGSAHPLEFGGLLGGELACLLARALRARGITTPVEFYAKPGLYVRDASLSASANGAELLHEAALRVARGERRSIGVLAVEQMRLKEREARTEILRSLIHEEEKRCGATMPSLGALLESYAVSRVRGLDAALRELIYLNRANACNNPRAHVRKTIRPSDYDGERNPLVSDPLRLWGVAPTSSGYAGIRIGCERPGPRAVRIAAIGQGLDRVAVSARDSFLRSRATAAAMANLPACCGMSPAEIRAGIRYAEIHDAFPIIEYQGLVDTGILDEEGAVEAILAGVIAPSGRLPVNLSGGVMGGHPIGATGLGQIVELYLQGMSLAETGRAWPTPHLSIALNVGGPATYNCITLLRVIDAGDADTAVRLDLPRRIERGDLDVSIDWGRYTEPHGRVVARTRLFYPPAGYPAPHEILFVETAGTRLFAIGDGAEIAVGDSVALHRTNGAVHARAGVDAARHIL
ncbi:MAG: thiolase C-terminal domain-containing protein [bacterium]